MTDAPAPAPTFSAIVLGGDRRPDDPLVRAAGVCCKALVPVAGTPMVLRVLDALGRSPWVRERLLCGPPREAWQDHPAMQGAIAISGTISDESPQWLDSAATPSLSAVRAMARIPPERPVLLTTADHALLNRAIVDYFCSRALANGVAGNYDVLVTLARHREVTAAYPGVRRTALRFCDEAYSGCNLFAFLTPAGRRIADFWTRVESQRKNPFRVVGAAGWIAVLRYLLGRLTLAEGLRRISRRLDLRIGAVILPFPEAAVDVDTIQDWRLVERIVAGRPPLEASSG